MNPVEINRQLMIKEVDLHRFLDCEFYEECLERCAVKSFISFTCTFCPLYVHPTERIEHEIEGPERNPEYDPLSGHTGPDYGLQY